MILVFGKTGQVATALAEAQDVTCVGRDRADLSDPGACAALIEELAPAAVINAAAYTAVDKAEEEEAIRTALSESIVAIISQGLCWTTDGKRAAYHDILISTEAIKDCLRQSKYEEILSLMKEGEFDGMITTNQSLLNLYQEGRITEETALENSYEPYKISCLLKGGI